MSRARRDRRGTWPQALLSLAGAIIMILGIRWAFFEPYVIPSGSMIPTLLIHDHILVNKLAYGIRLPFTSRWLVRFGGPRRGDVIVFRSLEDESVYLVKRVVGLPGDEIRILSNDRISINGKEIRQTQVPPERIERLLADWPKESRESLAEEYGLWLEELGAREHMILKEGVDEGVDEGGEEPPGAPIKVPAGSLFMVGDNRDNSSDSRVWGAVPVDNVLGRAALIWLSCEESLPDSGQLCDPKTVRWQRLLKRIW